MVSCVELLNNGKELFKTFFNVSKIPINFVSKYILLRER